MRRVADSPTREARDAMAPAKAVLGLPLADDSVPEPLRHGSRAVAGSQLSPEPPDVGSDGPDGGLEREANRLIGHTVGDALEDLRLSRTEQRSLPDGGPDSRLRRPEEQPDLEVLAATLLRKLLQLA